MNIEKSSKMVLGSFMMKFDQMQVWLRRFSLILTICKVMMVIIEYLGKNLNKTIISLQIVRIKLKSLNSNLYFFKGDNAAS